jgi:hypothetical protein
VYLPGSYTSQDYGHDREVFERALVLALEAFGLEPEPLLLFEHGRDAALSILTDLLHKDLVHDHQYMPLTDARDLANAVFEEHANASSRYFSNRKGPMRAGFNSFTKSTFDSGLIVSGDDGVFSCIWFEDED